MIYGCFCSQFRMILTEQDMETLDKALYTYIILHCSDEELKEAIDNNENIEEYDLIDKINELIENNEVLSGQVRLINANQHLIDTMINKLNLIIFFSEKFQQNVLIVPLGPAYDGWDNVPWYSLSDDLPSHLLNNYDIPIRQPSPLQTNKKNPLTG